MLIYILKFSACLAIFMLFYKLLLEKSSVHNFKRLYLLGALVLALVIPSLTFVEYIDPVITNFELLEPESTFDIIETLPQEAPIDYASLILWTAYCLGAFVFLLKFSLNLHRIITRIKNNPKFKSERFINVLVKNIITPHTFFSYIFLNKNKFEHGEIPKEVLLHEQTHAKQKHSIDVLILEFIQIIFWFNPLIYLLKRAIKLNHEFLADYAVLQDGIQPSAYQQLLLAFSSKASEPQLANAINYSSIKKRFTVMKTQTSKTRIWLSSLFLLPIIAILFYSFSTKEYVEKEPNAASEVLQISSEDYKEGASERLIQEHQAKATAKQITEYNALAKKYNKQPKDKRIVKLKDLKRLEYIYDLMSKKQKENAEPFPDCPPPPPTPKQEKATVDQVAEYNAWVKELNASENKIIKKKDLDTYKHIYSLMSDSQKKNAEPFPDCPPPPPPPTSIDAPEIREVADVPPPPPLPENATLEQKKKYKHAIKNYETKKYAKVTKHKNKKGEIVEVVEIPDVIDVPPPPAPAPAPKSSLDFVIDMAKSNAKFFYESKEISSDKAIEIVKKNDGLKISAKHTDSKQPIVRISKKPIVGAKGN